MTIEWTILAWSFLGSFLGTICGNMITGKSKKQA
jgi:hypothetical protein